MPTTVVHVRKSKFDVYIGRPSAFGNAHPIGFCKVCNKEHDRRECIEAFKVDFAQKLKDEEFYASVQALKDKVLGCFCAPSQCHGNAIAEWLDRPYSCEDQQNGPNRSYCLFCRHIDTYECFRCGGDVNDCKAKCED